MGTEGDPPGTEMPPRRASTSRALTDAHVYRPGPAVATTLLVSPVLLAIAGVVVSEALWGNLPWWIALVPLAWIPVVPLAWLALASVRTTSGGIAASLPWRTWNEISWSLIERVERRWLRVTVKSSDGRQIHFLPWTLHDSARLHREILMRLPLHVLDARFQGDARVLLGDTNAPRPDAGLPSKLDARPRAIWRWVTIVLLLAAAASVGLALTELQLFAATAAIIGAACLATASLIALIWLSQRIIASEYGLAVVSPLRTRKETAWSEVQLIEHTPNERVVRLRGERRLQFPGPTLFHPAERDLMRAYLYEYCIDRGVPVVERRWLW